MDAAMVGKTIRLNGAPTTVIGMIPQGFDFPQHRVDLWVPLVPTPGLRKRETRNLWFAVGRIADGGTLRSAQAEMAAIGRRLESAYPVTNRDGQPHVTNFHEAFIGSHAAALYGAIWGAVGFVLLIACANLANLQLARAIGRFHEISIRIALGASRWRITRQLLIDSVMLSSLGGLVVWWIARGSVRAYELLANPPSAYEHWTYALDYRVFVYLVAISIGTGLLFGLAPAVVLLTGAGLMIRSFVNIYTADLGVRTANILTAAVRLPVTRYPDARARIAFFEQLTARLRGIPG